MPYRLTYLAQGHTRAYRAIAGYYRTEHAAMIAARHLTGPARPGLRVERDTAIHGWRVIE